MTADMATQKKGSGTNTLLPRLTLAFALLTLCFALISLIVGVRLATLHSNFLKSEKDAVASEAASMEAMGNALKAATTAREATKQALDTEKVAADRLRKQLSAALTDLEKTRAKLVKANQTITGLKSIKPAEPTPSVESEKAETAPSASSNPSQQPPDHPETILTGNPVSRPVATQSPGNAPVVNGPEPIQKPAPEPLTDDSSPPAGTGVPAPVTEEPLTDAPPPSPVDSPAAQ